MSRKQANLSAGCVILFLLPFAGVGAFTAALAIQRAAERNWSEAFFFALFGLVFGGVGFGGIAAALAGAGSSWLRQRSRQATLTHPGSGGRTGPQGVSWTPAATVVFTAWAFAAFWNLISFPTAFLAVRTAIQEGKPAAFLALLFPLVGIGLVVWAVRATLRYRKYGVSRLELSSVPAVIGRSLIGMVRAPASIRPEAGFDVSLTCIRRVTRGGGKNRSTSESIVWQEERRVAGQPRRTARRDGNPYSHRVSSSCGCDPM